MYDAFGIPSHEAVVAVSGNNKHSRRLLLLDTGNSSMLVMSGVSNVFIPQCICKGVTII